MEIETKYVISKDKAEALMYRAAFDRFNIEGVINKYDVYYSLNDNPKTESEKFRIRKEQLFASSDIGSLVSSFLEDSKYEDPSNIVEDLDKILFNESKKSPFQYRYFYTYKNKKLVDDIEQNEEYEVKTDIIGCKGIEALMSYAKFKKYYEKYKKTFSFFTDNMHVELVNFMNHFWAEIEVTGEDIQAESAMQDISGLCRRLGIPLDCKDNRSWYEIETSLAK